MMCDMCKVDLCFCSGLHVYNVYCRITPCLGGSVTERLACWTQAQKGLGSNRSHDTVG